MIGDSHLAMMVSAQREQQIESLQITPVSWPRQFYDQLSLQGTDLCADGPELVAFWEKYRLPAKIDLTAFDTLVFVSYTITAFQAFTVLRGHAVSGWQDSRFLVRKLNSPFGSPANRRLITPAVLEQSLAGLIRQNHTYKFVEEIRKQSDIPIAVVPAPYLAEHTLTHRPRLPALRRILRKSDGAALAHSMHRAHEIAFGPFSNLALLRQPKETVSRGCLTKQSYRDGATRYASGALHNADDILHAGPLLGQLYLKDISALRPIG